MNAGERDSGLFHTREATTLGISKHQLTKRADRRMMRGVYLKDEIPIAFEAQATAHLVASGADAVLSHFSAAMVLGGVVPNHSRFHVTVTGRKHIRRSGVTSHRTKRTIAVTRVRGLAVTSGLQTFLDMAPLLDLVDLVVLGDSLVKKSRTTTSELVTGAAGWRGAGVALARMAAKLVRDGVESPMESRLRMLIVLAGLPEPVVDHHIYSERGTLLYRLDLAYLAYGLGIEYDGRQHAESDAQWRHDLERREYFDGAGWRIVIVIGKQFYGDPSEVLGRIVQAARAQGMALPDPNQAWRRFFDAGRC